MNAAAPYFKAVVGFIAPAAVSLTAAVQETSLGGELITPGEWVTAVCLAVITAAAVWTVPNRPSGAPAKQDEDAPEHRAS